MSKTTVKHRTLESEVDDRWRRKGGTHIRNSKYDPKVCFLCKGLGYIDITTLSTLESRTETCSQCNGTGEHR